MRDVLIGSFNIANYFRANQTILETRMETIAEDDEYGIEIFLSSTCGSPTITVMADDIQQYEITTDIFNLERVCKVVYDRYLDNAVSALSEAPDSEKDLQNDMDDRESELDAAIDDFLGVVLQSYGYDDGGVIDEIHDDVKEHFLEYLYRKYGVDIYRPMFLEDEDGEEFFEEYPYECMEFEDESNSIYMENPAR